MLYLLFRPVDSQSVRSTLVGIMPGKNRKRKQSRRRRK